MSLETFKESIDKIVASTELNNFVYASGWGESMLNPNFWDMIKYAKRKDCSVMLPSNGTLISKELIPKFRIIDALQLSFDSFSLNRELRGTGNEILDLISECKKYRIPVQLNVTIDSQNFDDIPHFLDYSIRHSVPIYFMSTVPLNPDNRYQSKELKYCIAKYNEIYHFLSQYHAKALFDEGCNTFKNCRFIGNDFSIAWDGSIHPCNNSLLINHNFGHISDSKSFDSILNSGEIAQVWKGQHPICSSCKKWDKYRKTHFEKKMIYDIRIDAFKNKHEGERCFVLGNGTSLTKEIIDMVRNEITIGVNQITLAKELWEFEPSYYFIADYSNITETQNFASQQSLDCPKFYSNQIYNQIALEGKGIQFSEKHKKYLKSLIAINWLNPSLGIQGLMMPHRKFISFDLRKGTLQSGTVIQLLSIPFAAWIGCNEIYLIGCDCDNQGNFYDKKKMKITPIGPDIIKQYGWFQQRLYQENKKLFNLSFSKLPHISNLKITDIFN